MHLAAFLAQPIDDRQRRTLTHVVDVFLISHAQQQHAGTVHRFAIVIQSIGDELHDVLRHARIYFFRQADEARIETVLSSFPRKIMRVERNAVAADSRTGIKGHEPERLGCRRANHFPRIDAERVAQPRHLVRHADVHRAKSIFKQLGGFGDARRSHRVNIIDDLRIESGSGCG